jgi:hypothetical protein
MFKYNKAWVAGIVAPLAVIVSAFLSDGLGLEVAGLETAITMGITALITFIVPNKA